MKLWQRFWREEEAHRRRSEQPQQQPQQQQQQRSDQGRPRSISPARGQQIHNDDVKKGKSVTPRLSHGGEGSKGAPDLSRLRSELSELEGGIEDLVTTMAKSGAAYETEVDKDYPANHGMGGASRPWRTEETHGRRSAQDCLPSLPQSKGRRSWRTDETHRRRTAQDYPGDTRHHGGQPQQPQLQQQPQQQRKQQQQQWSNQGKSRSVSPARGQQIHHDNVNKGKSVTPRPSHGGGGSKGGLVSRGPPPQSPPPPPPENLEEFLFSDSPTGSPRASPRAQGGGVAHSSTPRGGCSSSGSINSKDREAGGEGRSGEDLLNFGNDSGGGRPKQASETPPPTNH